MDSSILPTLVTFSDGNEEAFGTVAYALYTLTDGSKKSCLLASKAKLCPLTHKSEVVKSELSAATFSSRLRQWIVKETGKEFGKHIPILDSRIVQDMIKKESYIYNTFAGLRVKEIQEKTDVDSWVHVPSAENIADLLTKGTSPDKIASGSIWQNGPSWLTLDTSEWPITKTTINVKDIEKINSLKKSCFQQTFSAKSSNIRAVGSDNVSVAVGSDNVSVLTALATRCNSLSKFLRVVARLRKCFSRKKLQFTDKCGFRWGDICS